MTQEHPITPPPELVQEWIKKYGNSEDPCWQSYEQDIATQAARWGADQELEACCEWFVYTHPDDRNLGALRAARRPKPPSLKEQALDSFDFIGKAHAIAGPDWAIIRRALEALPDD